MLRYLIAAIVVCALQIGLALAADLPEVKDAELAQVLELAGRNRAQLEQALFNCQQQPFTVAAMRFLIASLPVADLGTIMAAELEQQVQLAMQARGEFAYCAAYDDAVWAHYVLPPRVSQEPLSAWRPFFYNELRELVADCTTLEQAAVKVNAWCGERVKYQPTQSRDQGPLVTLKSGFGRCEEMVIFYLSACRAVGIPARQAYCPYWSISDDNHAWAEVLGSDGRWHFAGGCEPAPVLDSAWFGQTVKNAPLVVSVCFGWPGPQQALPDGRWVSETGEEILSGQTAPGAVYTLLNSTANYRQTGLLKVRAPDASAADRLSVYVFNYGALRQIARIPWRDGSAVITLGAGSYVLTAPQALMPAAWLGQVLPGQETAVITGELPVLPPEALLHFPADPAG